jgi:hypothetical protein
VLPAGPGTTGMHLPGVPQQFVERESGGVHGLERTGPARIETVGSGFASRSKLEWP